MSNKLCVGSKIEVQHIITNQFVTHKIRSETPTQWITNKGERLR